MGARGYFGKRPTAGDFLLRGLPARTTEVWAEHMTGWIAAGRGADASRWTDSFVTSPVWRFALAGGVLGREAWAGLLAGSVDSLGREFPFTVMIAAHFDPAEIQPLRWLNPRFDALEEHMLAFIEGGHGDHHLAAILDEIAGAAKQELGNHRHADPDEPPLLPHRGQNAVCVTGHRNGSGRRPNGCVYSLRSAREDEDLSRLCMWWHQGSQDRPTEFCVTRGIPSGKSAVPFFLDDWEGHGWERQQDAAAPQTP